MNSLNCKSSKEFWKIVIFCFGFYFLNSCNSYAEEIIPYIIQGSIDMNSEIADVCSVELKITNRTDKAIEKMTVVFYLFDSQGEAVLTEKSNIVISIDEKIEPMENLTKTYSLDPYFCYAKEDEYSLDYLYISRILFEDGSVWEDPFGMKSFR